MKASLVSAVLLVVLRASVADATPVEDATAGARPAPEDRSAAAAALFHQALEDMEAGRTAEGCDKLATSVAMVPDSSVLGALAECNTALGRLSEAWELWRDLSTSAPTPSLRDYATTKAAALDRWLARVVIRLRGAPPANLVVTLNGKPVRTDAVEHRVDPGRLVVVASSPEIARWTQTFAARRGSRFEIQIPVAQAQSELRGRQRARWLGLSLVGAGTAAFGVGAVYGGLAYADWQGAGDSCGGDTARCNSAGYASAQGQLASARRSATIASWTTGIGLGVAALGLVTYLSFRDPAPAETARAWRASPMAGPHAVGVVLTRSMP
jgi:hypothetical protein